MVILLLIIVYDYLFIFAFFTQIIQKQSGLASAVLANLNDRQPFPCFWHSQCFPRGLLNYDVRDSNSKRTELQTRLDQRVGIEFYDEYKSSRAGSDIFVVNSTLSVHRGSRFAKRKRRRLREKGRSKREKREKEGKRRFSRNRAKVSPRRRHKHVVTDYKEEPIS